MKVIAVQDFHMGDKSYKKGDKFETSADVAERLAQERLVKEYDAKAEAADKAAEKAAAKEAKDDDKK